MRARWWCSSLVAGSIALASCVSANAPTRLLETGSTLLYPLMNLWVADYQRHRADVQITTQGTGSGTGLSQAITGVAQIGASDAYTPKAQIGDATLLNIPLAISAQLVVYNLPGLKATHLRLSGPVLAAMYDGTLQYWDDPRIVAANAALRKRLPHRQILPIHRADGSGDTFLFTQYLSDTTPSWQDGPSFGTSVSWPPTASVGATGNPGVLQTAETSAYSIAYVGISFMDEVQAGPLGYAALRNRSGAYVLPSPHTIVEPARVLAAKMPRDERISLVYAPGADSYPLVNYEYAIVNASQPDVRVRAALRAFLRWTLSPTGGQRATYLDVVHFVLLPQGIVRLSSDQVAQIH